MPVAVPVSNPFLLFLSLSKAPCIWLILPAPSLKTWSTPCFFLYACQSLLSGYVYASHFPIKHIYKLKEKLQYFYTHAYFALHNYSIILNINGTVLSSFFSAAAGILIFTGWYIAQYWRVTLPIAFAFPTLVWFPFCCFNPV